MPILNNNAMMGMVGGVVPSQSPTDKAAGEVSNTINAGQGLATGIIGNTQPATISNPYSQQWNDYLGLLKSRLGGMTQQELQTEQDQGLAGINQQLGDNQERLAGAAGAQGLSGGVSAGLQAKALNQAQQSRTDLQRQLVLDNITQKNNAMQAYGGALNTATGFGLDTSKFNAGATNSFNALKLGLPIQLGNMIQGQAASDTTNDHNQQMLDLIKSSPFLNGPTSTSNIDTSGINVAPTGAGDAAKKAYGSLASNQTSIDWSSANPGTPFTDPQGMKGDILNGTTWYDASTLPSGIKATDFSSVAINPTTGAEYVDPRSISDSAKGAWDAYGQKIRAGAGGSQQQQQPSGNGKIICTEAHRQELLSDELLDISREYGRQCMTTTMFKGYWTWGRPVVRLMKRSRLLSRAIAAVLPTLIAEEAHAIGYDVKSTLTGRCLLFAFRTVNRFFGAARRRRILRAAAHG